jgi:hypothetical protein
MSGIDDMIEVRRLETGRLLGTLHGFGLAPGTKSFSWSVFPSGTTIKWADPNDPMTPVQGRVAHAALEAWHFQARADIPMLLVNADDEAMLSELKGFVPLPKSRSAP